MLNDSEICSIPISISMSVCGASILRMVSRYSFFAANDLVSDRNIMNFDELYKKIEKVSKRKT